MLLPIRLWQALARAMSVDGVLPGAVSDDLGMCPCKTLRITIRRERHVQPGNVVTTGSYTYGHITLYPCVHCTPAFLTQVYLHELAHAWLHQHHPAVYDRLESCPLAERFANAGFRVLGGKARRVTLCSSYSLPYSNTLTRLDGFRILAKSLTETPELVINTWRPASRKSEMMQLEG